MSLRQVLMTVYLVCVAFGWQESANAAVVPGTSSGAMSVGSMGQAQYSMPIVLPPGVQGIVPNLSFQYSSQAGNGMMGVGWSVSGLPSITRCPQTSVQDGADVGLNLTSTDRFCLNGQRLILVSETGAYGDNGAEYRTEIETFTRVISYINGTYTWFKVWTKDGLIMEFGNTADSRLLATQTYSSATYSSPNFGMSAYSASTGASMQWGVNKVTDRSSNYYLVTYELADTGRQIFPKTIVYTGNENGTPVLPTNKVIFNYGDRPKVMGGGYAVQYVGGGKVELTKILTSVDVEADGVLARKYSLEYRNVDLLESIRPRLYKVTECTYGSGSAESCFSSTEFEMTTFGGCFYDSTNSVLASASSVGAGVGKFVPFAEDFDGDGRTDLVSVRIGSAGIQVLAALSTTEVPEGTVATGDQPDCSQAGTKPGQAFSATQSISLSPAYYGSDTDWKLLSGDVNSDGLPDIVAIPLAQYWRLDPITIIRSDTGTFSLGSASVLDTSDYLTTPINYYAMDRAWLMDVDGDGVKDIVASKYSGVVSSPGMVTHSFYFRKGIGDGTFSQTTTQSVVSSASELSEYFRVLVGEQNGDGRADLVTLRNGMEYSYAKTVFGSTSGSSLTFTTDQTSTLFRKTGIGFGSMFHPAVKLQLADVNRDGYSDLVMFWFKSSDAQSAQYNKAVVAVALGVGGGRFLGFDGSRAYETPGKFIETTEVLSALDWKMDLADANGDGLPDLFLSAIRSDSGYSPQKRRVWTNFLVNTGEGRFLPAVQGFTSRAQDASLVEASNWNSVVGDFDGDGLGDVAMLVVNNTHGYYTYPLFARSPVPDLLTDVTDGNGSVASVSYASLARDDVYTLGDAEAPIINVRPGIQVVTTVSKDSGNELDPPTWHHFYGAAAIDPDGRGFLGFGVRGVVDPEENVSLSFYFQAFPVIGMEASTFKVSPSGVSTISITFPNYKTFVHASGKSSYFPYSLVNTLMTIDANLPEGDPGAEAAASAIVTSNDFDDWGNLVSQSISSDGQGNVYTKVISSTYYQPNTQIPAWDIGFLNTTQDHRTGPTAEGVISDITRTSKYTYASGLLKQEIVEPNDPDFEVTTDVLARDRFGNVTQSKVYKATQSALPEATIDDRIESTVFDPSGRFALTRTNAEGHLTTISVTDVDVRFGLPKKVTDANGISVVRAYDDFGRLKTEQVTGASVAGSIVSTDILSCDSSCLTAKGETYIVKVTPPGASPVYTYVDRNGRERRTKSKGMDGNDVFVEKEYDSMGRVARVSKPYTSASTVYWVTHTYDLLGRPSVDTIPGAGTTTYEYYGYLTTVTRSDVTNTKHQVTKKLSDVLGRTVSTIDAAGKTQTFAYDAFGNTVRTTDAAGNVTLMSFDKRGRKISQNDPDMGLWEYKYDVLGQLKWQQSANQQVPNLQTRFTYDKLGRMKKREEQDLVSDWVWDTQPNGIGKLASLKGDNGFERIYTYDGLGRRIASTTKKSVEPNPQTVDRDFVFESTYDNYGRPSVVTYPTGLGYKNVYDNYGYLKEVRNAADNGLYWRADERNAAGQVTKETLGNGLTTARSFKPDTGYLDTVQTGTLSGNTLNASVQNDVYSFDDFGNLDTRSQYFGATSVVESFQYDNRNRLTLAIRDDVSKSATYDDLGNITSRSDVGVYSYAGCGGSHRVCRVAGVTFLENNYDANGNLLTDDKDALRNDARTSIWTSSNYPSSITRAGVKDEFVYSPERDRVLRTRTEAQVPISRTLYLNPRIDLGGTFEKTTNLADNSVVYTHHIYAGNQIVGSVVTSAIDQWSADLAQDPVSQGISMPNNTQDPPSLDLVAWDSGGQRIKFVNKYSATTYNPQLSRSGTYSNQNVVFSAEITTGTNAGTEGRFLRLGVLNNGSVDSTLKTSRNHFLLLKGNRAYAYYVDGSATNASGDLKNEQDDLGYTVQDNVTYVMEIETTPSSSVLYFYPKGSTRTDGVRHPLLMSWLGTTGTLTRSMRGVTRANASDAQNVTGLQNVTFVDNLEERTFVPAVARYFHADHLGSLTAITDGAGAVLERLSYDAWGKRRNPDGSDDALVSTPWAQDLNGDTSGLTVTDPNSLLTWSNAGGAGRFTVTNKSTTAESYSVVSGNVTSTRTYLNDVVRFRGEIQTTVKAGGDWDRYIRFGVQNNGSSLAASKTYRLHEISIQGSNLYASLVDGSATDPVSGNLVGVATNLNFAIADNTTYVIEIETTPFSSVLFFYPKGQTRQQGVSHVAELNWRSASNTLIRKMRFQSRGAPSVVTNTSYIDNLSETVVGSQYTLAGQLSNRGYTMHEHLDKIGVVHMNGRVYDPLVGRFMSADPNVFFPMNTQDFNRYSYVHNNPLSYGDPSGFCAPFCYDDAALSGMHETNQLGSALLDSLFDSYYQQSGAQWLASNNGNFSGIGPVTGNTFVVNVNHGGSSANTGNATTNGTSRPAVATHVPVAAGGLVTTSSSPNGGGSVLRIDFTGRSFSATFQSEAKDLMSGHRLGEVTLDTIGKVWTLPNTVLGGVVGGAALSAGVINYWAGFQSEAPYVDFGNNAIQFRGIQFGSGALTLGNAIIYGDGGNPDKDVTMSYDYPVAVSLGLHEKAHTLQSQVYGPFFLPAYFLEGGIVLGNAFENWADKYADGLGYLPW